MGKFPLLDEFVRELFGAEGVGKFGDAPATQSILDFKTAIKGEDSIFNWYKITSILNYERIRTGAISFTEIIQKIFYIIAHHIMRILEGNILFIIGIICCYLLFKYLTVPIITPILSAIRTIICFIMNTIGIPKIAFLPEFMPFKLIYKGIIGLLGLPDFFKCDELSAGPFDIELGSCGEKFGGINTIETGCYGDYATDYTLWAEGSEGEALCSRSIDCVNAPVNKLISRRTAAFNLISPSINKGIGSGTAPNKYLECCLNQGQCPDYNTDDAQKSLDFADKSPILSSVGKKYMEKCPSASVTSCTQIDNEEQCNSTHQLTSTGTGKMRCQWDIEEFEKMGNLNEPCNPSDDTSEDGVRKGQFGGVLDVNRNNYTDDGPRRRRNISSPCLATHPKFGWKGFCASDYMDTNGTIRPIADNPAWKKYLNENYPDMAPDDPKRNGICGVLPDVYCDESDANLIPATRVNCAWKLGKNMSEMDGGWADKLHGKQLDYYFNAEMGKWVQGYISGYSRPWRALSHDASVKLGNVVGEGQATGDIEYDPGLSGGFWPWEERGNNVNGCGDNVKMSPMRQSITSRWLKKNVVGRTNGLGFREVKGFNEKYNQCYVCGGIEAAGGSGWEQCPSGPTPGEPPGYYVPPFTETPPEFGCYKSQDLCVDSEEDPENACPPEQRLYSLSGNNKCVISNNPETEVESGRCNQSYVQIGGAKFPCEWKEKEYAPCEAYEPCGDEGTVPDYIFPNVLKSVFKKYVADIPVCKYSESNKCDDNDDENKCEREVKLKDPDDNNIKICTNTEGESDITNQALCDTSYITKDGEKYQCKLVMEKDINVKNNFKNVTNWQTTKLFFDKERKFNFTTKPEHQNCLPVVNLSPFNLLNNWVIIPLYSIYHSVFNILRYLKIIFWISIFLLILILYYNIIDGIEYGKKIKDAYKVKGDNYIVNKGILVDEIYNYFGENIKTVQIAKFINHISSNTS